MKMTSYKIRIKGIVQGVGFRPFIYRLAKSSGLSGYVLNDKEGVLIKAEGSDDNIRSFIARIKKEAPVVSKIRSIKVEKTPSENYRTFEIKNSLDVKSNISTTMISPDIATCSDCLYELFKSDDYRYKYPFINCTNCGPRFTIIQDVPYDRKNTTMSSFKMCPVCSKEYNDPSDRRFHAQPVACEKCGPHLKLLDTNHNTIECDDIIAKTVELIKDSRIIAIKGIGGYHLACNALDEIAVEKLRKRKFREDKPFAMMAKNIKEIGKYAYISKKEEKALLTYKRPIVLLRKKKRSSIAKQTAPKSNYFGFMLPYTPLQYQLFDKIDFPIVMTSANISDEPLVYKEEEAFEKLKNIADHYLINDRPINSRCDDSILKIADNKEMILRRARGFVPSAIYIKDKFKVNILALGAELKSTFALGRDNYTVLSQHLGDLENYDVFSYYEDAVELFKKLFYFKPDLVAYDMHPNYYSTQYAKKILELPLFAVQHHHAHIAGCMAENNLKEPVIGIAWDGTGYGTDGTLWGSEFFIADQKQFKRFANLNYVKLPGGEKAIKEPWRIAISYLHDIYSDDIYNTELSLIKKIDRADIENIIKLKDKNINSPLACGMGRLFDAVSAIVIDRDKVNYEGQAAVELEMFADYIIKEFYDFGIVLDDKYRKIQTDDIFKGIIKDKNNKVKAYVISAKFHNTLALIAVDISKQIRKEHGINNVVISGGVFQNSYLLKLFKKMFTKEKFKIYTHNNIPPNDGGISFGQLIVANKNLR